MGSIPIAAGGALEVLQWTLVQYSLVSFITGSWVNHFMNQASATLIFFNNLNVKSADATAPPAGASRTSDSGGLRHALVLLLTTSFSNLNSRNFPRGPPLGLAIGGSGDLFSAPYFRRKLGTFYRLQQY
jgi:hypothetical protein